MTELLDSPAVLRFTRIIFPALLTIISGFGLYILNDFNGKLAEIKASTDERGKVVWQAISKLDDSERKAEAAVQALSIKFDDRATASDSAMQSIQSMTHDHEGRLRVLESHDRRPN